MHYLYTFYTVKQSTNYCIEEASNLENRLEQHNTHNFKKNFTKAARDWESVLSKICASTEDAKFLERFIESKDGLCGIWQ